MTVRRRKSRLAVGLLALLVVGLAMPAFLGAAPARADPTTTLYVDPPSQNVAPGATFNVQVMIQDVTNMGGYETELHYDPDLIHVTAVELGAFPGSTGNSCSILGPEIDNVSGMTSLGAFCFGSEPGPDGEGEIALVTMEAVGDDGTSPLDLQASQVTDKAGEPIVPISEVDGEASILGLAVNLSGDTYVQGFAGQTVSHSYTITNTGGVADSFSLALSGNSWPSTCPSNTGTLNPDQTYSFDVNVQIPSSAGGPDTDSFTLTATSDTTPTTQDSATGTTERMACDAILLVDPPYHEASYTRGAFNVSMVISDVVDLGGFEFTVTFDPTVLHAEGAALEAFPGSTGRTVSPLGPEIDNVAGSISFGAFSFGAASGPDGSGAIATLTFSPQTDDGETTLHIEDATGTDTSATEYDLICHQDGYVVVTPCYWADFDCDGDVDVVDLMLIASHWGCSVGDPCYDPAFDVNDDETINVVDLMLVATEWGWVAPE